MVKQAKFEVSAEGLRELQAGRLPWQLAKELVSNSFDEETVRRCTVDLTKSGREQAILEVTDDGAGFRDLKDAWTIWAHTPKRYDPHVRGRFNVGEKEILSVASKGIIATTSGTVNFDRESREVHPRKKIPIGTIVTLWLNWSKDDVEQTVSVLKHILPPEDKEYVVNGETVPYRQPGWVVETTLETVLLKDNALRPTKRKTEIHIHRPKDMETPTIMEMGIPIQPSETPYHIDVQQKVPMNQNRDAIKTTYIQDLYADTLNAVIDEITEEQISDPWIRIATKDARCDAATVRKIKDKRYGKKALLWSSDMLANERAREAGFTIIHPKTMSTEERERFQEEADLVHSSEKFQLRPMPAQPVTVTPKLESAADFIKWLGGELLGIDITVDFYRLKGAYEAASWSHRTISFNMSKLREDFFEISPEFISLVIHEFAHYEPVKTQHEPHDKGFRERYEKLAGEAVVLAVTHPEKFQFRPPYWGPP